MSGTTSRRRLLGAGTATAAGLALATTGSPAQASTRPKPRPRAEQVKLPAGKEWIGRKSANGWAVLDEATKYRVQGAPKLTVRLAKGPAATALLYVVRRYAYEIDTLRPEELAGHTTDRTVGVDFESNYLSGTAVAIQPMLYPLGGTAANGMSELAVTVVEDILADVGEVVAWGGELDPLKQSHFHIATPPGDRRLEALADRIGDWNTRPGKGAGGIDAFNRSRISRSRAAKNTR
ncbi:hypothetical protein [Streptomyces brevispora]|uniref:Secreted protein n=1 Tax=Streptomyces brevispora TaxID=887462 RepID=A0A561UU05_9ACTN|nr:hypothetical protein [Streptomyces brevispora]TWG02827.1 hypothetical protein FHX80_111238 [Streptomyces brevispora]WSC16064.1 hypothetical protein OIE64_26710 [Streptomyces brevispora]